MDQEKTQGRTEIIKIVESGLNSDKYRMLKFMTQFIESYPNSDLRKPFEELLKGNLNPDKLTKF